MRIVVAGYGFLGQRIVRALISRGDEVTAVKRNPQAVDDDRLKIIALDLTADIPLWKNGEPFDAAIYCLAPGSRGIDDYRRIYTKAQENFLQNLGVSRYIYISSTAVYPDAPGIYDESAAQPHSERAEVLLAAEAIAATKNSTILRLAGLYAKERPIFNRETKYTEDKLVHLVHANDAARAVVFALDKSLLGTFNVHDGHPQRRSDMLQFWNLPYLHLSRMQSERRISNQRIIETKFEFAFPDYFAAIESG